MELSIGLSPELRLLVIGLICILFLLNVFALYRLLDQENRKKGYKILWLALILLLPPAGAIAYIVSSHKQRPQEVGDEHS